MGFEDFKQKRKERLNDPELQRAHEEEWERVKESFSQMGSQAKITSIGLIYHSVCAIGKGAVGLISGAVLSGKGSHGKKEKKNKEHKKEGKEERKSHHRETLGWQALEHAWDGGVELVKLVWRILDAAGRTTKYGARRALAI